MLPVNHYTLYTKFNQEITTRPWTAAAVRTDRYYKMQISEALENQYALRKEKPAPALPPQVVAIIIGEGVYPS